MFIQRDCLRPAARALPLLPAPFSSSSSSSQKTPLETSVTFCRLYMWTVVPSCAHKSPLLLQCHLQFGALWQRPLSQALRVSWVRLAWNSTVPDGRFQRPRGRCEALPSRLSLLYTALHQWQSQGALHKSRDSISWKMTPRQLPASLEFLLFHLRILEMH